MLTQLNINNFAIIEQMSINFEDGLSVITGQTGAGKSIVIDAIAQLLGARSSLSMISNDKDHAYIEGVFTLSPRANQLLLANDIKIDDDYLIIAKKIKSDGKSQLKINNRIVTQDLVKKVTNSLVEINSQYATYELNNQVNQQVYLDGLFNDQEKYFFKEYQAQYKEYKKLLNQKEEMLKTSLDPELLDYFQAQMDEINQAIIEEKELKELEDKEAYYLSYEKIADAINNSISILEHHNIKEGINQVDNALVQISDVNDTFNNISSRLKDVYYELEEISKVLRGEQDTLAFDEVDFELTKERLYGYQKMIKKYGYANEVAYQKVAELNDKIDYIKNSDGIIDNLNLRIQELADELAQKADQLSTFRTKYQQQVETIVKKELTDLYMPNATFAINLEQTELSPYGRERVKFLFSANKGYRVEDLSKVASGGEMSRLMLALKIASANSDTKKTIIFDEIDTGVSGEVAEAIGRKIKEISRNHSVISITHLFQVAMYADQHLYIEKNDLRSFTTSNAHYLSDEERIYEIAKMLSGNDVTQTALQHAKELLNHAQD